jgi:radical SAM superfamily enzyme YgiQ (UPF0313 family)
VTLRVALCYPNRRPVGRSNLGFALLRARLGALPGLELEERFADRPQRGGRAPDRARPLYQHELLIFSVPFEGDYLGLVEMLRRGEVEPLAARRTRGPTILIGGLAPTLNPEPLAAIADLVAIGDAEPLLPEIIEHLFPLLEAGAPREALLRDAALIEGIYVPSRYRFDFDPDGRIAAISDAWGEQPPPRVKRRFADRLDAADGLAPVVADDEIFAGCAVVEATRGCLWGCRFCAAGFAQRPFRERGEEALWRDVEGALQRHRRVGLVGADLGDLSHLPALSRRIHEAGGTLTPSALRAAAIDDDLARALTASGKKTATLAPETGSARLRAVINKQLDDGTLLAAAARLAAAGIERLRLYFLIGLPGETDADVDAMVTLALRCRDRLMTQGRKKGRVGGVTLSVTPFVPKPTTPFQWEPFADQATLRARVRRLRRAVGPEDNLELKIEPVNPAREQAALARGDRRLGQLLIEAVDGDVPLRQLIDAHPEISGPALAGFERHALLPWAQVDHLLGDTYLWRERERAYRGKTSPPCDLERCRACDLACAERA